MAITEIVVGGLAYRLEVVRDRERDGMALEVALDDQPVLEIFRSAVTGALTLTAEQPAVPVDLVLQSIAAAHQQLPGAPDPPAAAEPAGLPV